jgi:hypothetical protein
MANERDRLLARDHIESYYDRWRQNFQLLIDCAQNANAGVEEIISIPDSKSLAGIVVSTLLEVGFAVAIPAGFAFSKAWAAFKAGNKVRADAIEKIVSLAGATKGQVQNTRKELEKRNSTPPNSNSRAALRIDILNQMTRYLHGLKAEATVNKENVRLLYTMLPLNFIYLNQVYLTFPKPGLLGEESIRDEVVDRITYAFEWMILMQYVKNNVTVAKVMPLEGGVPFGPPLIEGVDGLSRDACKKIFERLDQTLTLDAELPVIGKTLQPVTTFDQMIAVWNCKTRQHSREWRTGSRV